MKSMTGFGFAQFSSKDFKLKVTVKSLNSRFTDIKLAIPSFYRPLEKDLKKILSNSVTRGQFVVHIDRFPSYPSAQIKLSWNRAQARKWKELYKNLSREMKVKNDLTASDFVQMGGVVKTQEISSDLTVKEKNEIKMTFKKALNTCLRERSREGLAIKRDISNHLKTLQGIVLKIKKMDNQRKQKNKKKISKKNEVMEKEAGAIDEEIMRFGEHLGLLKKMLYKAKTLGRKLDFYTQELVREMNTIGSKSQISELTLQVIDAKAILEKIREQAQNIE